MTYFERYKNGQLAEVWNELAALGEAVRDPAMLGRRDADLDVHETAKRVGFSCPIAPDILHKDNVSGGAPYAIELPEPRC